MAGERLKSLTEEQYHALYEGVKSEFTTRYPRVMAWKGPTAFERMIKFKMVEKLDRGRQKAA